MDKSKIWTFKDCEEYLRQRGFDPAKDPARFGFRYAPREECGRELGFKKNWFPAPLGILFPYYKLDGVSKTGYVGVRCIGSVDKLPTGEAIKFWTPSLVNQLYIPPRKDWDKIPVGAQVEIHESILKCIAATKLGAWAVAINGCHGWSSKNKTPNGMAKGFESLPWVGKQLVPVLVLDSNGTPGLPETTAGPMNAREKLTALCKARLGVELMHKYIPPAPAGDGSNWGFDDFAAAAPADAKALVDSAPVRFEVQANSDALAILDESLVIVQEEAKIYETFPPFRGYTKHQLAEVSYSHLQVRTLSPAGIPRMVPAINVWTTLEESPRVRRVVYMPGEEKRMLPNEWLNIWQGMGVEPERNGSIAPLLAHLNNVLPVEEVEYLLDVWSYPLQNLGKKVAVCPVLEGDPGTGKTLLVELLSRVYGKNINAVRVDNDQMKNQWSEFLAKAQFVSYEEVIRPDNRGITNVADLIIQRLKKYITEDEISVKQKFQDDRMVKGHANFLITTNHVDALKIERGDRRFSVHRFDPKEKWTAQQWRALAEWIEGPGPSLFYGAALDRDLSNFNPHAAAMHTAGKDEMVYSGLSPRAQFILDHRDDLPQVGTAKLYENAYQTNSVSNYMATSNESMRMSSVLGKELRMPKISGERFKILGSEKETWWDISTARAYGTKELATEYMKDHPWDKYQKLGMLPSHLKLVDGPQRPQ